MDRKLFKMPFTLGRGPQYLCPTCQKGTLRIRDGSFVREETKDSRDHSHEAWEPEWIHYVYSCLLDCENKDCGEVVANSGTGSVDSYWGDYDAEIAAPTQEHYDYFHPKYFEPSLQVIAIPAQCDEAVSAPLKESFRLFFASPGAAANNIRIAVEELLTVLKIKRFVVVNSKNKPIALHSRIMMLPARHAEHKDMLLAIKWLGNAGSHGGKPISADDVMDAYELMEHILDEIYSGKRKVLSRLANKVNRKRGPIN
jgi:hypothetical protein